MGRSRWVVSVAVVLCLLGPLGCAGGRAWFAGADCGVVPVSTLELPATLDLRARMRLTIGSREIGFDAIAQRRGEALHVVGLVLPGTRIFALRQEGEIISFEGEEGRSMRALGAWAMDALHRGVWIGSEEDEAANAESSWVRHGEVITESIVEGCRRRIFKGSAGRRDAPDISIDYRPNSDGTGGVAYTIRNPQCGYEADVILLADVG